MSKHEAPKQAITPDLGYDRSEPMTGPIVANIIGILVFLVVVIAFVNFYFTNYVDQLVEERQLAPVSQDLLELRAKEDQALGSYAVTDKTAGTVRLPVSRAMELVISESKAGAPKYPVAPYAVKKVEDAAAPAAAAAPAN